MPEPYQIFFPLGLFYALEGVGLWILHVFGAGPYPGPLHSFLMIGGFLFSFAAGFLMTAVPRFTGGEKANSIELSIGVALALAPLLTARFQMSWLPIATSVGLLAFLSAFFGIRFSHRQYSPPEHFLFLPLGLGSGILGGLLLVAAELGIASPEVIFPARVLFYQGVILSFVLGIGGKLVTALLGRSDSPLVQISRLNRNSGDDSPSSRRWPFKLKPATAGLCVILALGFITEFTPYRRLGSVLRAIPALWIGFFVWKLHRLPLIRGRLPFWLWISSWSLVLGMTLAAVYPAAGIHALHLVFIGGFGLMTLMVASRVTLAHGGYDPAIEGRSKVITVTGSLILLAALARLSAPWSGSYTHHLGYAALTWVLAIVIWAVAFLPKILHPDGNQKGQHR